MSKAEKKFIKNGDFYLAEMDAKIWEQITKDNGPKCEGKISPDGDGYPKFNISKHRKRNTILDLLYKKLDPDEKRDQVPCKVHVAIYCYYHKADKDFIMRIKSKQGGLNIDHIHYYIQNISFFVLTIFQ